MTISPKKKKIIIICLVTLLCCILLAGLIFGIIVAVREKNPTVLSNIQREILLKRGDKIDYTDTNASLVREISENKPLNMITYYGDAQGVTELWQEIPDDIKEISVLLLIKGNILAPGNSPQSLIEVADECDKLNIPYAVQFINGETHYEWIVPLSWIEEEFCSRPWFYGMSTAELYNGEEWRGQLDGDMAWYVNDGIRLMAKYGLFMFITDTNKFGTYGTFSDWIEENEYLYTTMQECSEHIIMQNKESYGDPSSYSLMKGLYLAGLIGGWGVSTDWWHWQVSGYKVLFKNGRNNIDNDWEQIYYYPEIMQTMSMAMVAANGGFCFKNEAEFYSVAVGGKRTATFQWCTIPFFRSLFNGTIRIPSKEEVLSSEKVAIVGAKNYKPINYDLKESTLYPNTPKYSIISLLPQNLRPEEADVFNKYNIKLIDSKTTTDKLSPYVHSYAEGNTYMSNIGNQWLYLNNCENKDKIKAATATQTHIDKVENIRIESGPHGYVFFTESSKGLSFSMNNYRVDKYDMVSALDGSEDARQALTEWIGVDKSNNTIKAYDKTMRKTVITMQTSTKPTLSWHSIAEDSAENVKPYTYEENYADGVYTLTINHNGYVGFDLLFEDINMSENSVAKQNVENNIFTSNANYDYSNIKTLLEESENILANPNLYSETAFAAFRKEYSLLKRALEYKNVSSDRIDSAVKFLKETDLLQVDKYFDALKQAYKLGVDDNSATAFDRLLRAVLSPTKYYNYKDKSLKTYLWTQRKNYTQNVFNMKTKELNTCYDEFLKS